jgi:ArsR family transcriptional regulator
MTVMLSIGSVEDGLELRLRAVAFGERRALLASLLEAHLGGTGGMTITELAVATGTTRFTASRHLAVLRDAGLVNALTVGTRRLHRIDLDGVAAIDDWLCPFLDAQSSAAC